MISKHKLRNHENSDDSEGLNDTGICEQISSRVEYLHHYLDNFLQTSVNNSSFTPAIQSKKSDKPRVETSRRGQQQKEYKDKMPCIKKDDELYQTVAIVSEENTFPNKFLEHDKAVAIKENQKCKDDPNTAHLMKKCSCAIKPTHFTKYGSMQY